jgi:hypothetical protein
MSKTETVQTAYGETEIEVVECDSCGTTISTEQAREFTLGDREGHACEHCVDEGPISFPSRYGPLNMGKTDEGGFLRFLFWAPVVIPLTMMLGPVENDLPDEAMGAM